MTATFSLRLVNLHARNTREAQRNSVPVERAERVSGMISSFQRDSGEPHLTAANDTSRSLPSLEARIPEPDVGEKWPKWKSVTFLIVYCSAAWAFIGAALWLLLR